MAGGIEDANNCCSEFETGVDFIPLKDTKPLTSGEVAVTTSCLS